MFDSPVSPLLPFGHRGGLFKRAANRPDVSQLAVCGHLRKLKGEIGKPLLLCTTRSMELTPAGEILTGNARGILDLN